MPSFPLPNTAYDFRPLKLAEPPMAGWDVYALQTALNMHPDGAYGRKTRAAVLGFQERRFMDEEEHDGVAGIGTQRKLTSVLSKKATKAFGFPTGCPYGHTEKESGGQLGNHSARRTNGTWDVGMCQCNTQYHSFEDGFDAPGSLDILCRRIEEKWTDYEAMGEVDRRRAFELACGSWNAPAWTDALAEGQTLSPSALAWIEAYIGRVVSYVKWEEP